jgi:prolyl oligopeptidase
MQYPFTRKDDTLDDYRGVKIPDPFRWLEDDNSSETAAWVKVQNEVTREYLAKVPFRETIRRQMSALYNYPRQSMPERAGEYLFYTRNDGLQNQAPIYYKKGIDGEPKLFFDPNTLSEDGTARVSIASFSPDNKIIALQQSGSGSDWCEIFLMSVPDGNVLPDRILWTKFSGVTWYGNGFFYSRFPQPREGDELTEASVAPMIYYHEVGTSQEADLLVFTDPDHPRIYLGTEAVNDGKYLYLTLSSGTSGEEIRVRPIDQPNAPFTVLFPGFDHDYFFIDEIDGMAWFLTNDSAPNFRLVRVDPLHPESLTVIVPEGEHLLEGAYIFHDRIIVQRMVNVATQVELLDLSGNHVADLPLPGLGSVSIVHGRHDDPELFYSFTSFNTPGDQYFFDGRETTLYRKSLFPGKTDHIVVEQEFAVSADGTRVPMFIVHRADMVRDGNRPALLYGYGGFNVALNPEFSVFTYYFVDCGGVMVIANLRGGSEFGESWHKAGMLKNKHHVFEDFIACAEHLIARDYTRPERLAIRGGSNGGLLTGACMNLRPDLFKAVVTEVGVLDMLRYQKFTVGWGWIVEYGSSEDPEMFDYLLGYSPYHNLTPGGIYPSTLVTTADHDDRVVPAHSFKYTARLQEYQASNAPTLIRVETKSGHGGSSVSKAIDITTDVFAFIMNELGMQVAD